MKIDEPFGVRTGPEHPSASATHPCQEFAPFFRSEIEIGRRFLLDGGGQYALLAQRRAQGLGAIGIPYALGRFAPGVDALPREYGHDVLLHLGGLRGRQHFLAHRGLPVKVQNSAKPAHSELLPGRTINAADDIRGLALGFVVSADQQFRGESLEDTEKPENKEHGGQEQQLSLIHISEPTRPTT